MELLPTETIALIISYLDQKSKRILRAINSRWYSLVKYSNFTLYLTKESDLPLIAERFSKYLWPIELEFKKPHHSLSYSSFKSYLTQITTLTGLKLRSLTSTSISGEDSAALTTLTNLQSIDAILKMDLTGKFCNLTSIGILAEMFYQRHFENFKLYSKLESVLLFFNVDKQKDVFQYFSNPTRITSLHLNNYGLQNTEHLTRFVNLKSLGHETSQKLPLKFPALETLFSNRPELLEGLETCTNLTSLDLANESPSDTAQLSTYASCLRSLTKLKKLSIAYKHDNNRDETMKILLSLPHLEEFTYLPTYGPEHLYLNVMSYIISKKLTKLECLLNKAPTAGPTMSCIRQIGQLTTLKELNIRTEHSIESGIASFFTSNRVEYEPLMNLTNLTNLRIVASEQRAQRLGNISKLTKLRNLYVSAHIVEADLSALTNLENLHLMTMDQKSFASISTLTLLTNLQINTNAKKIKFSTLDKLRLLRTLHITPLVGISSWQNLTLLTDLRELWIADFDTTESVVRLTSLQNLTFLHCINSKSAPINFATLTSLQKFYLSSNVPKEIENDIVRALPNLRHWMIRNSGGMPTYFGPED
jgi:hypothetical protein